MHILKSRRKFFRPVDRIKCKQTRRKLLCILDSVELTQRYPAPMQLEFFEPHVIEQVIREVESKLENEVVYCDIKMLHRVLMNELNNYQGNIMAAQRVRMIEEVENILQNVVLRNKVCQELSIKHQSFDAWRQVTEVLLNACPEDLLPGEIRQTILFELLQELLQKVADEDALMELTSPVSGVILTLMTNLRQCFLNEHSPSEDTGSMYPSLLDSTATSTQTVTWGEKSGSRTLFATSLKLVLQGLIDHILKSSGGQQRVRANLYGALLYYLQISQRPEPSTDELSPGEQLEGVAKRVLSDTDSEYDQLIKENINTILSYGDAFMDTVCRDACDGHDVGRMLALSVLDMILSMDKFQQWLTFMSSKGYLQHIIDSILHDDQHLQTLMEPNPELRTLYIYESKMGLLIRVAESTVGAHTLLQYGILQRLASCVFFDLRPNFDRSSENTILTDDDEFIPSPMARYRQLLFAGLKLCQALMTSLGVENQDAGNQVLQFTFAHSEVIHQILSDRQHITLNLPALRELALVTAVIALANTRDIPEYSEEEVEFDRYKSKVEMQMISLLPKYCMSERLNKQLKGLQIQREGRDVRAELSLVYQEIAANVTSFCRTIISVSGPTAQYTRKLFRPSLEEAMTRDLRATEEYTVSSLSVNQAPSLGVVVYQLRQCANNFMSVYDTHQQHLRKLQSLADLSTDDLKEFSGVDEKITSHQRQKLAKKRLTQIVKYKSKELQQYSCILSLDIIENCLFILWRHLEHYLIHCVPVRQTSTFYDSGDQTYCADEETPR
ncbi:hypothetical protein FSP39_000076 [Pinctada imbricata]|uniref:Uncharacterized protein n=1 Tax=Pinctada imbricata TaxID=66713 RepID=A0AA89BVY3_PINIB|nr:hypothetical protein FSP39_000076 [Pinctada imbricata]